MIRLFAALVALASLLTSIGAESIKFNGHEVHPFRILAKYKANATKAKIAGLAASVDTKQTYSEIPGLVVLEVKPAALKAALGANYAPAAGLEESIRQLKASGLFQYVEPDYVYHGDLNPTDRRFLDGTLWGLLNQGVNGGRIGADINVVGAWDITTGDRNIVVAVIDSGINYTHRDLATQVWVNPGEIAGNNIDDDNDGYIDNVYGINAILDNGDPKDDLGHGSHCAGTIGAAANNGFDHVGVIWNVQLMGLKFLGSDNSGFGSDAIQCINFSIQKKVKISSNSWGGGGFSQALFDAISAARINGQLFVAAAGNDGSDNDRFPSFPNGYDLDNIISVAALDRFDRLADFSNYGATTVDIGAPGVEIFSCWFDSDVAYNTIQGTSMACPHVTGAAALLLSADPSSDYLRLRDRILQRGTPIPALAGRVASGSRLNVLNSMSGQVDNILEVSVNPSSGAYFLAGSTTNILVRVTDDFNVNNATVTGRFNNANVTFVNTGAAPDASPTDGTYTAQITMPTVVGFYDLSIAVSATGKNSTNLVVRYEVLNRPANDDFATAQKIPPQGAIRQADNRLATIEPNEPVHAGVSSVRSLWWVWSTPTPGSVIVDLAGTSFDDDAVLAVYTGEALRTLTEIGASIASANGPNGTRAPFVKFTAEASVNYRIAVAQSETGTNSPGRVTLRLLPGGDIDTTIPTIRITNYLSGVFLRSATNVITLAGVADDPPPNASGIREADGVQYKGPNDLVFQVATGSTNWTTRPIQLNPGFNTIFVKAFDRAENESITVQFTVNYIAQEQLNDLFPNATSLTGLFGSVNAPNNLATAENGEPNHGPNLPQHSLWWTFTPPTDGSFVLTTEGSDFDTVLALYTLNDPANPNVAAAIKLAENDDVPSENDDLKWSEIPSIAVEGGRSYYIAVDGYAGATGVIQLNYTFSPNEVFQVTLNTGSGGTVTTPSGPVNPAYPAGTVLTLIAQPDRYKQLSQYTVTANGQTISTNADPFTFALTGNTVITAEFGPKVFTDDFESGTLTKLSYQISESTTEGQHWINQLVTTNDSGATTHAARVSSLLQDRKPGFTGIASLVLVTNLLAGKSSFEFTVNSEVTYDKLEFLMDGVILGTWSGKVPWQRFEFSVPQKPTPIRLEWRYSKDPAVTVAGEFVAIDNLDLRIAPPAPPVPINLSIGGTTTGLTIVAEGAPNRDFVLESSTDLVNWGTVSETEQNSGPTGTVTYNQSFSSPVRFYRVRQL